MMRAQETIAASLDLRAVEYRRFNSRPARAENAKPPIAARVLRPTVTIAFSGIRKMSDIRQGCRRRLARVEAAVSAMAQPIGKQQTTDSHSALA
jgi:hypothetical protein